MRITHQEFEDIKSASLKYLELEKKLSSYIDENENITCNDFIKYFLSIVKDAQMLVFYYKLFSMSSVFNAELDGLDYMKNKEEFKDMRKLIEERIKVLRKIMAFLVLTNKGF